MKYKIVYKDQMLACEDSLEGITSKWDEFVLFLGNQPIVLRDDDGPVFVHLKDLRVVDENDKQIMP